MFGLTPLDLAVIICYFAILICIGIVASRRVSSQEDYFLGGRKFGKFFQVLGAFGQATSSEHAIGAVANAYKDGAGGIWSQFTALFMTPFYWFISPWYRRMRILTLGDFFLERYRSRAFAMAYAAIACGFLMTGIAMGLKAVNATVRGITLKPVAALSSSELAEYKDASRLAELRTIVAEHRQLSPTEDHELHTLQLSAPRSDFSYLKEKWILWTVVGMVLLYAVTGGLSAAVWAEAVQAILIIVLSFLILPFAISKLNALVGTSGWSGAASAMRERLPDYFFSVFGSAQGADFTWYFICAICLMVSLNVAVQANQLTATASSRDEHTASVGFLTGILIKRYITLAWGYLGLVCVALYGASIRDPDLVWGHATRDLLGPVGYGLIGLMLAALLAALQSTVSTLMIAAASLFTKNIYSPVMPGRSESHYVMVGRVSGLLILVLAALMSLWFDSILQMMKFSWEFNCVIAASFWCGLKWRGASRIAAWTSCGVATFMFIVLPVALPALFPSIRTDPATLRTTRQGVIVQSVDQDTGSASVVIDPKASMHAALVGAKRSLYWSQGIVAVDGTATGRGMFYFEMFLLDRLVNLSHFPYALCETIRYAYKILLPFLILIAVSIVFPPPAGFADEFFIKMRTPVRAEKQADDEALAHAFANPESTRRCLLFPRTQLEFMKWDSRDARGFAYGVALTAGVVVSLWAILQVGS